MTELESESSVGWTTAEVQALLGAVETVPLTDRAARTLAACLADLRERTRPGAHACAGCNASVPFGEEARHAERCERHPGRLRHDALLRVTERLVEENGGGLGLEPLPPPAYPPADVEHRFFEPFANALRRLSVEQRQDVDEKDRPRYASVVLNELRWRLHVADRTTEPCPWCGGVWPLEGFREHLWTCEAHPGARRAVALADALRERYGDALVDAALADDAVRSAREAVRALVVASQRYAASMGYAGDGQYYTKHWSEVPWRAALDVAECIVADARAAPMSPAVERHLTTLATLVKRCQSFWSGMGEGERGASLIQDAACREWEAQVAEAAASLGAG